MQAEGSSLVFDGGRRHRAVYIPFPKPTVYIPQTNLGNSNTMYPINLISHPPPPYLPSKLHIQRLLHPLNRPKHPYQRILHHGNRVIFVIQRTAQSLFGTQSVSTHYGASQRGEKGAAYIALTAILAIPLPCKSPSVSRAFMRR